MDIASCVHALLPLGALSGRCIKAGGAANSSVAKADAERSAEAAALGAALLVPI
jgi:hypothetical protein